MRPAHYLAVLSFCAILPMAFSQEPAAPETQDQPAEAPAARGERPLTPAQLRERQIRMRDPLDKSNPLLGDRAGQQEPDPEKPSPDPSAAPQRAAPLPGSVAASNAPNSNAGPRVVEDQGENPVQDYSGPAVLSRSYTLSRPMLPQSIRWKPVLGFAELYQTGLPAGASTAPGVYPTTSSFGYNATWGITGRHLWKHDQVGLDYHGSADQYGGYRAYNGVNHLLNVDFAHAFSRHLILNLVGGGAIYSQSYSLENAIVGPGSVANINLSASPNLQVLDQGTRQWTNQATLTWKKSARLSFTAGGGLFFVERTGVGIAGNTGRQAQADVNYRYTRKTTVGVYYSFTDYAFTHRVSLVNFHTLGGIYSYALNRSTQIRLRAGASWVENESYQVIQIAPEVAALTGQSTGIVDSYRRSVTSDISFQAVKDFGRNRTANFAYARGISPG
ncbi:MAG: hypothetical protein ABUS49_11860, partial [Acidobacteriota bacterium]